MKFEISDGTLSLVSDSDRNELRLEVGVKTDPIEYRYTFDWLFRLLEQEGVRHVQLGTFFEIYQLPDAFFRDLRRRAEDRGLAISSIFTAHRELGGYFRDDGPGWVDVAHRNFTRLIQVGGLVGASSVGSNPGAVMRDRMGTKAAGAKVYVEHVKQLLKVAADCGVEWVGIEPMSCLAEPPTLPDEMRAMAEELYASRAASKEKLAKPGYCLDVAHGYADRDKRVVFDNVALMTAALPWTHEVHLKNTDALFNSTFGFGPAERERGIIKVEDVRDLFLRRQSELPVRRLVGYLEIGGPKTGRDYSDGQLEDMLRVSLRYCKEAFTHDGHAARGGTDASPVRPAAVDVLTGEASVPLKSVLVAPSMMCADACHFADELRKVEAVGVDLLHFDVMDAAFVPNMPLGLATIEAARACTALPFDVHLMVRDNDWFVQQLSKVGVQQVSVHAESATHLDRTLSLIKDAGAKAGVALNPATPLDALDYVLEQLDFVVVMTVNPGFAGQKLVRSGIRKIADCRKYLDARGRADVPIEVDGNVSFDNIPRMVQAGARVLVAGTSSLFSAAGTMAENMRRVRELARK